MNRHQTNTFLPFIRSFCEGKELQYLSPLGHWEPVLSLKDLEDRFLRQVRYKPKCIYVYTGLFKNNRVYAYSSFGFIEKDFTKLISSLEKDKRFIKWLGKKEYTIENNTRE